MLTDRQRARCRELAAALDSGDQRPWLRAEASLSVAEKGAVWDARAHVVAAGGRGRKKNPEPNSAQGFRERDIAMTSATVADLDYWSDTEPDEPDDDDDDDGDVPCAACDGRGEDEAGNTCTVCGGSGKVAPGDSDDEEDDDERDDED
jgi:hypothetical protein